MLEGLAYDSVFSPNCGHARISHMKTIFVKWDYTETNEISFVVPSEEVCANSASDRDFLTIFNDGRDICLPVL